MKKKIVEMYTCESCGLDHFENNILPCDICGQDVCYKCGVIIPASELTKNKRIVRCDDCVYLAKQIDVKLEEM